MRRNHRTRISPLKHETPLDRDMRHRRDAIAAGMAKPQPLLRHVQNGFDVTEWERQHRAAEDATLMFHAGEN